MIAFLQRAFSLYQEESKTVKEKKAKASVAQIFNNRYTYCHRYHSDPNHPVTGGFAWMCPTCNQIHMNTESKFQFLTGNHFPACCEFPEGHRHYQFFGEIKKP